MHCLLNVMDYYGELGQQKLRTGSLNNSHCRQKTGPNKHTIFYYQYYAPVSVSVSVMRFCLLSCLYPGALQNVVDHYRNFVSLLLLDRS